MPGGAQRELPLDVFFFKFTLCQGSNAGGFGWEGVSGCIGGGLFLPLGYLYFNFFNDNV